MRWRSGGDQQPVPLNKKANEVRALPSVDDDEQDYSSNQDQQHYDEADDEGDDTRRRLGSSTSGLPPSTDHDDVSDELADASQNVEQKPRDATPEDGPVTASPTISNAKPASDAVVIEDDDDPGLDHALPPEDSAEAQAPVTAWRPQNQQSTCEFTHTIVNYSQKRESGCKKAEYSATTVDDCGNRWRLIVYVNGNGRASNHHLSLFLQVADADELPFGWKKAVSYVLTLEHPSGANVGYAKRNPDKTFKLCPKAIDWGWSQFITSDRIQQEGYVSNDSLTVRASVTVKSSSISIDPEDAELYLKCAVEDGSAEAVKACLAQGAGVNCQFKDDLYTPLHTACSSSTSSGSLEVLNLLLQRGADGNACNKWRETPLLIAANNGHGAAVEALLKSGADPSLCSEAGWSALTFAAHKGYDNIVSLLLKANAPVNCRVTEDLSTPLHKACAGGKPGHLSAVKQLLDGDADVHALNKWRETPLLTAANHGQASAVEALLKAGADPCKCTDTGWSPLSIAAYKGHDDVVRLLLEEGAPTEEADPTLSALLQAATKGLPDTVELLLRHGADHTVTTKKGDTALSILVEQNLIDAAVRMVMVYKASVPRCSRDRKKVQRARLLINLRVKQQQREGLLALSSDEDETDHYDSDDSKSALHDANGSPKAATPGSGKKKKKKKKDKSSKVSAEEQARAAEEALLLELEQEDAKAKKEKAAANSKRDKKKKKRERERQQKLKEEQEQREKAEREAKERERQQKLNEEKERKEREQKARQQREREMKEAAEREKEAAAKRKEKEERDARQRVQEKKEREKLDRQDKEATSANTVTVSPSGKGATKSKGAKKPQQRKSEGSVGEDGASAEAAATKVATTSVAKPSAPAKKRGWETKSPNPPTLHVKSKPQSQAEKRQEREPVRASPPENVPERHDRNEAPIYLSNPPAGISVEEDLENMATGVVDFLGFDSVPKAGGAALQNDYTNQAVGSMMPCGPDPVPVVQDHVSYPLAGVAGGSRNSPLINYSPTAVELPAVALYRQDKVAELFQRCALARSHSPASHPDALSVVDESIIKIVLSRWIVRAAHDKTPFLDCIIPSWTDFDVLTAFFQRQFISESRKGASGNAGMVSIEALKEAGSSMASLCHSLAKDLVQFRNKHDEQIPQDWGDAFLSVTASEVIRNGGGSMIVVDWASRARIYVPATTFATLRDRHLGPPARFLTALFAAKKRYEIFRMIFTGTPMDCRLIPNTQAALSRDAAVSIEVWTDPFSAYGTNVFCGIFPDVDVAFGGLPQFGKEGGGGEVSLMQRGGSVSVLPPLDSMAAALYVRTMVDALETADKDGVPLSFTMFLPSDCFRDLNRPPKIDDLPMLDGRLGGRHGVYVRFAEVLLPEQHVYQSGGEGVPEVCRAGSLFVVLQNEAGKIGFVQNEGSILNVIRSMSLNVLPASDPQAVNPIRYSEAAAMPPVGFHEGTGSRSPGGSAGGTEFGTIGGMAIGSAFSNDTRRGGRRGRLFELIDDGEDDNANDVDVMSGMLNNLNVNLFQNNSSQDVDIEAISLMGIGGAPLGGTAPVVVALPVDFAKERDRELVEDHFPVDGLEQYAHKDYWISALIKY